MVRTMNIGQKIKKARLEKGYTQEELAELIGVKKSAVAKWENGRVSEIKRSNLKKLSTSLNIEVNSLLDDIEEKPVETANKLADMILGIEIKEDEDVDLNLMLIEYKQLDEDKKAQAREFIHFLLERS